MAEKALSYLESVTENFKDVPIVKQIHEKTGVEQAYIALGLLVVLFLLVLLGLGSNFIVNVVGILYPAYMSFKAIESDDEEDDKQWLTYWVVFSTYSFVDHFADYLFFWVPGYFVIKMLVLVYMFWPETKGALRVYNWLIQPILTVYQGKIDSAVQNLLKED